MAGERDHPSTHYAGNNVHAGLTIGSQGAAAMQNASSQPAPDTVLLNVLHRMQSRRNDLLGIHASLREQGDRLFGVEPSPGPSVAPGQAMPSKASLLEEISLTVDEWSDVVSMMRVQVERVRRL